MTSPSDYTFPDYYHLPPFFTLQPVEETRRKQLSMWVDLLLGYLEAHRERSLVRVGEDAGSELFCNAKIDRKLSAKNIRVVLDEMVRKGFGNWVSDDECAVSFRTAQQWGDAIFTYAFEHGLLGDVVTVYELRTGEDYKGTEFSGLGADVILAALETLQARDKVAIMGGDSVDETAVKFLAR